MRVTVIGSAGYVGVPLCDALREAGHVVTGIDARLYDETPDTSQLVRPGDPKMIELLANGSDAVVWLAALAHDPEGKLNPYSIIKNNFYLPLRYIRALSYTARPVRFVLPSSMSIFSSGTYPQSKRRLEDDVRCLPWFRENCKILRFGTLYGLADRASFRAHLLLNSMVLSAVTTGKVYVRGPHLQRPTLSVFQAVQELQRAVEADKTDTGQIVNVYEHCASLYTYAAHVAHLGKLFKKIDIVEAPTTDDRSYGYGRTVPKGGIRDLFHALKPDVAEALGAAAEARMENYYKNVELLL